MLYLAVGGQVSAVVLARFTDSFWMVAVPWLASLVAAAMFVLGRRPGLPRLSGRFQNRDLWIVGGLTLLASLLRLPNLETMPAGIHGDEGEFGELALNVSRGEGPAAFGVAFLGDPALYVYVIAPFVKLLGPTMEAIRLPSALIGIATVSLLYGFVRNLYGRFCAAIAAFLLATSAVHIHFSRMALNVIWVPFFTCLALWLLKRGMDRRGDVWFLLAGIAGGIGFYFHFGARLILPMLGLLLATQLVADRSRWRTWIQAMIFVATGGLLALSPLLAHLSSDPQLLTAHTDKRAIWNNWERLAERYDLDVSDKAGIVWEQIRLTFLAFISEPDSRYGANMYRFMDMPLLPSLLATLAIIGLVALAFRIRTNRARIVLVWFVVPVIFASVLTDVAGQSHRLINPLLPALIAIAFVVDAGRRAIRSRFPAPLASVAVLVLMVVPLVAGARDGYRYLQPGATDRFGVAGTAQARCLEALPSGTVALIAGEPRIYARHGASRYLGHDIDRRDLDDPLAQLPPDPDSEPVVILVHEWNLAFTDQIREIYPDAPSVDIYRPDDRRAMTVFAIAADRRLAETLLEACEARAAG